MKLQQKEYTQIEFTGDGEYDLVGTISMHNGKMVCAEISDNVIINAREVDNIRAFLDEVDKILAQETDREFVVHIDDGTIDGFIKCS